MSGKLWTSNTEFLFVLYQFLKLKDAVRVYRSKWQYTYIVCTGARGRAGRRARARPRRSWSARCATSCTTRTRSTTTSWSRSVQPCPPRALRLAFFTLLASGHCLNEPRLVKCSICSYTWAKLSYFVLINFYKKCLVVFFFIKIFSLKT